MITFFSRKRTSSLALAIAMATGAAVATTAVMPTEASAQRKKKKDESDGGGYSKEFIAVYQPLNELMGTEGSDLASQRAQFDALAGLLNTPDEKIAGGGLMFNSGVRLQDPALQLKGMEAMLASGMVEAANTGRYNFIAYQLADRQNMVAKARTYLQAAIDNNFTADNINPASLRIAMMESYFGNSEFDAGIKYLNDAIAEQKAAGQTVDEAWYRRGISVAYENELTPAVYEIAAMWLSDFPSETNWRDSINIARNLNNFTPAEMLDLFRLSRQTGALNTASDYDFYIEVADARRGLGSQRGWIGEVVLASLFLALVFGPIRLDVAVELSLNLAALLLHGDELPVVEGCHLVVLPAFGVVSGGGWRVVSGWTLSGRPLAGQGELSIYGTFHEREVRSALTCRAQPRQPCARPSRPPACSGHRRRSAGAGDTGQGRSGDGRVGRRSSRE